MNHSLDFPVNPFRAELIRGVVAWKRRWLLDFRATLHDPQGAQMLRLSAVQRQIAGSAFARDHGLKVGMAPKEWRHALPVAGYERVASYIERVGLGEKGALFHPRVKVHMLALTSGTTAPVKYIPVTEACLQDYRRSWTIWGCALAEAYPSIPYGKMMSIVGDWRQRLTPAGIPCGSITGLLSHAMRRTLRVTNILPPIVATVHDTKTRYYLSLKLALAEDALLMINTASPSTLLSLARELAGFGPSLMRDLMDGTLTLPDAETVLSKAQRLQFKSVVKMRHPVRARFLEKQLLAANGQLVPKLAWPRLQLLGVWTGGTLTPYLPRLSPYFGDLPKRDHGLSASEGRITIPLEDGEEGGVLNTQGPYCEFIPEARYGDARSEALQSHELVKGERYYVVISTTGGLCRYDLADLVECTGFVAATPILKFLHKASHIANLVGEKLSAFQAAAALKQFVQSQRLEGLGIELALAPIAGDPPFYALFLEKTSEPHALRLQSVLGHLDDFLCSQNMEYADKRRGRRLGPVALLTIPADSWHAIRNERLRLGGGTIEQYKHPFLLTDERLVSRLLGK